jgi:hypothetical protein
MRATERLARRRGVEHPLPVRRVGIDDRQSEYVGDLVGVLGQGARDDRRHQRRTCVQRDPRFGGVLNAVLPPVDRPHPGDDVARRC